MQTRTILVAAFAVVFGVISAVGAFISQRQSSGAEVMVEVVTAADDLPWGTILTEQLVKLSRFPKDSVPAGALTEIALVTGRTTRDTLSKGQMLLQNRLTEAGAGRGLPPLIPKGMRAVSIQTPTVSSGVTGFVVPGNKVDVVLTMHGQGTDDVSGGGRTITLLQNVSVLAVDQNIEAPTENKMDLKEMRTVTLVVTPKQAQELDLGQNKGILRLTLRNPLDEDIADVPQVTITSLTMPGRDPLDSVATSDLGQATELASNVATTESDVETADHPGVEITTPAVVQLPEVRRRPFPVFIMRGSDVSQRTLYSGRRRTIADSQLADHTPLTAQASSTAATGSITH
jgi:pilus assembly protein CpaB